MIHPVRLQLRRERGFDLQRVSRAFNGLPAINCARSGVWGNPFVVGYPLGATAGDAVDLYGNSLARPSPHFYRAALETLPGHNLACWCEIGGQPCHVDTLLDIFGRIECREVA